MIKVKSFGNILLQIKKNIITFIDLCGHEKYLKTTMFGLLGMLPDYAMVIVGANSGLS